LGLRILFATEGITTHPIARRPIQLSWSEIDFVNAIPAAEQIANQIAPKAKPR